MPVDKVVDECGQIVHVNHSVAVNVSQHDTGIYDGIDREGEIV